MSVILRGTSPGRDGAVLKRHSSGKPMHCLELADLLCAASEPVRAARRAQVACFGTLVPHVFMAAVLHRVGECVMTPQRHAGELEALLHALELGMAKCDRETRDLIAASFVRDGMHQPFFERLKPYLDPKLLA